MTSRDVRGIGKQKETAIVIHGVMLLLFVAAIVFAAARYGPYIAELIKNPERLKSLVDSYGYKGIALFILIQVIQVVFAAIPGEAVQVAGGYIYGTLLGTAYLIVGAVIGMFIVFFASRLLGYPLVRAFVPERKLEKLRLIINGKNAEAIVFIVFLLPGMPKDVLTYIAGLTPIKPVRFIAIATLARFPALIFSAYIGATLKERDFIVAAILLITTVALFFIGVIMKDRIICAIQSLLRFRRS